MGKMLNNNRGLSLIELVVAMVILSIIASVIIPSARMVSVRNKEIELRRNLRDIRSALDEYKKNYEKVRTENPNAPPPDGPQTGYPETLEVLVEGHDFGGVNPQKKKFLRRIPKDPFYTAREGDDPWGMRSHDDEKDSDQWGGQDVFDVYSRSEATAIDGTQYKEW